MLTADKPEVAEPKRSDVKPELTLVERAALIDDGYLTLRPGEKGAQHLVLTDKAWDWAASANSVSLLKSRSAVGAEVLEALLNRLLPNLKTQGVALAEVLRPTSASASRPGVVEPQASPKNGSPVPLVEAPKRQRAEVLAAVHSLAAHSKTGAVRLAHLRAELSSLERTDVDNALRALRDEGALVLFQDDDRASLTAADHQAALIEANTPHHLIYLEKR